MLENPILLENVATVPIFSRNTQVSIGIFSIIILGLGIAEISSGAIIFDFLSNSNFGAWWAGLAACLTALLGISSIFTYNVCLMGTCGVFALIAVLMTFVGALVDGIEWNIVDHNRACYSPATNTYYGESGYYSAANSCSFGLDASAGFCSCVEAGNYICFQYNIVNNSKYNCGDVLGYYTTQLQYSTIFCSILIVLCLVYSIVTITVAGITCCCLQRNTTTPASPPSQSVVFIHQHKAEDSIPVGEVIFVDHQQPSAPPGEFA
mmetsp:Transcript_7088/g.10042  ORF Transcript_7088/g.10042 Transcript_7088/m.10042 type:complete len:264 (-) Transcript_7088:143-934(-)